MSFWVRPAPSITSGGISIAFTLFTEVQITMNLVSPLPLLLNLGDAALLLVARLTSAYHFVFLTPLLSSAAVSIVF